MTWLTRWWRRRRAMRRPEEVRILVALDTDRGVRFTTVRGRR